MSFVCFGTEIIYHPTQHAVSHAGLEKLEVRRRNPQSSFIAGFLLNTIDAQSILEKLSFLVPRQTSRQSQILYQRRHNTLYGANAPLPTMIRQFNTFSRYFDFNTSHNSYKQSLPRV